MSFHKKRKAASILLFCLLDEDETSRTWKRGKTRKWIKRRPEKGYFNNIVRELRMEDTRGYKEMMRMNYEQFMEILTVIEPLIAKKQVQGGHKVISPAERLTLTIRFLATGESFSSLHFQFRIGKSTISYIVREVCKAMHQQLGEKYLSTPRNENKWREIASEFDARWQFPNCIGAIDGKHLVMQPPTGSGSHYFNYKHTHSVVLMAIAGPDYECLYADVGTNGRISDGGVWNKCTFLKHVEDDKLEIPKPVCLPLGKETVPYVLVGDDAFALRPFLMKPYPQRDLTPDRRVYNYRLSRARRVVENLFGILANRWRLLLKAIQLSPDFIGDITFAMLTLHNLLRQGSSREIYCPKGLADEHDSTTGNVIPGTWRPDKPDSTMSSLNVPVTGHNMSKDAKAVRELLKDHFINEGCVPWQWERVLNLPREQ